MRIYRGRLTWICGALCVSGMLLRSPVNIVAQIGLDSPAHTLRRPKHRSPAAAPGDEASDRDVTQKIWRALRQDRSLTHHARNLRIRTVGGHVTLEGAVRSAEDRQLIESKAIDIAGALHVSNALTIETSK